MNKLINDALSGNISIDVYLCAHCNLRCRACVRYCSISKPKFYDKDKLMNDIKKLDEVLKVKNITLTGGEPLLYPNISELLYEIRKFYKKDISIFTNGKVFVSLGEKFFIALKENNIRIVYTKYPNINYDEIHRICEKYNVAINNISDYSIYASQNVTQFLAQQLSITETKSRDFKYKNICNDTCPCIWDSKIWLCGRCALVDTLNEKYGTDFKQTPLDYIEISKLKNKQQFFNFIKKPVFFCKYCFNKSARMIPFETKNYCKEDYIG